MDALSDGRRLKALTIADDFTKEVLDIAVARSITRAIYSITSLISEATQQRYVQTKGLNLPVMPLTNGHINMAFSSSSFNPESQHKMRILRALVARIGMNV